MNGLEILSYTSFFICCTTADCGCVCRWWCVGNAIRQQLQPLIRTQEPVTSFTLHQPAPATIIRMSLVLITRIVVRLLHKLYLCDSGNKYLQAVKAIAPCVPHSEVSSNSLIESYSVQRTQVILQSSGDLMINLFQGPERLEIFLLSVSKSIFLQF